MGDILIVDDDADMAMTLGELFAQEGHVVRVANDGLAGLAEVDARFPDVVVLDIEMPVLDGPAMAARLLIENVGRERIPVVMVSGFLDLAAVAGRLGTPYCLPKPSPPDAILGMVNRALTERIPPRPPGAPP
jgi:CheY-like chemotaxis protein